MGHSKGRFEREVHSDTGPPKEDRKISNKQSNFALKGAWKRTTNKAQSRRKEIIKIQAEIS